MLKEKIILGVMIGSLVIVGLFILNVYLENRELKDKLIGVLDDNREAALSAIDELNDARVHMEAEILKLETTSQKAERKLNNEISTLRQHNQELESAINRTETARRDAISEISTLPPDELGERAGDALRGLYGGSPDFVLTLPDQYQANTDAVKFSLQAAFDVEYHQESMGYLTAEVTNLKNVVTKQEEISQVLRTHNASLKELNVAMTNEIDAWGDYRTASEAEIEVLKKHSKRDKIIWLAIGIAGGAVVSQAF